MMTSTIRHPARAFIGAAALALALVSSLPVSAQDATPAAPAPDATQPAPVPDVVQQATPVPDVAQPEPPASQLAAAREVVISSGMSRSFGPMVPQLSEQIVPMLTRTRPELTADLTEVVKELGPEFTKDGDEMTNIAAHIYARRMSEAELKETAAFFNSPVGKKYVDIQPPLLDDLVVAMQSWTNKLSSIMMTRVRQEMIKKGHNDF
jgi:hypothetical protein